MSTTTKDLVEDIARRAGDSLNFTRKTCLRGESVDRLCQAVATRYDDGLRAFDAGEAGAAGRHFARFMELCERIQAADADAEFGEL